MVDNNKTNKARASLLYSTASQNWTRWNKKKQKQNSPIYTPLYSNVYPHLFPHNGFFHCPSLRLEFHSCLPLLLFYRKLVGKVMGRFKLGYNSDPFKSISYLGDTTFLYGPKITESIRWVFDKYWHGTGISRKNPPSPLHQYSSIFSKPFFYIHSKSSSWSSSRCWFFIEISFIFPPSPPPSPDNLAERSRAASESFLTLANSDFNRSVLSLASWADFFAASTSVWWGGVKRNKFRWRILA